MSEERIRVFDSQSDAYKRAFQVFLQHTDQKRNAHKRLEALIGGLRFKRTFIDAGAGNGELTGWVGRAFERIIAIEPNRFLCEQLRQVLPGAEVIEQPILGAAPSQRGDLVLSSHTFYYIPQDRWLEHLERLTGWMSPSGVTVVITQSRDTDCVGMFNSLAGRSFDLSGLVREFRAKHGARYQVSVPQDEAHVETRDFDSAYIIAEFMMNTFPGDEMPSKATLARYLQDHFRTPTGGYRFSCHQDFVQIAPLT